MRAFFDKTLMRCERNGTIKFQKLVHMFLISMDKTNSVAKNALARAPGQLVCSGEMAPGCSGKVSSEFSQHSSGGA